jgi:hypothetical protein
VESVDIPLSSSGNPVVLNIYPSADSVPENLLKVYVEFSKPMRVGRSLEHITLLREGRDTIRAVFLELQPELWNHEATILTLWLDPGRIKRDLQPNMRMGKPLQEGIRYTLVVSETWADAQGNTLPEPYLHTFHVVERDTLSPDPDQWDLVIPRAGSTEDLRVQFGESVDAILLREAFTVETREGQGVDGTIIALQGERSLLFRPSAPWPSGQYYLQSEGRLEDLAGNNLNRPFDRDILSSSEPSEQALFQRAFIVQ